MAPGLELPHLAVRCSGVSGHMDDARLSVQTDGQGQSSRLTWRGLRLGHPAPMNGQVIPR